MKPLFYYGSALEFSRLNSTRRWGPFATLSFRFGFPGRTGIMEDRDWQTDKYNLPAGTLTDFSSHDNYTRGAALVDASIGVSVPIASPLALRGYITYSYMFFAWYGRDGYGDYYSSGHQVFSGAVINYSQMWNIVSGGIALSYPFLNVFSVSAAFQVGTVVSYSAVDDHLTNKQQFIDTASGGLLFEPRFEFTWSPLSKLSVVLNAGYRYISALKGRSVSKKMGISSAKAEPAGVIGAAYSVWDAGLSVKICF
jgi:outer membrane protease